MALAVSLLPEGYLICPAAGLSAWILSAGRSLPRKTLRRALLFWLFLAALWTVASAGGLARDGAVPAKLATYLFLGSHLFLIHSPFELGRGLAFWLRPFLGRRRVAAFSVALMALVIVFPAVLEDGAHVWRNVRQRVPRLSFARRVSLGARVLARLTARRTGEMAEAFYLRRRLWPLEETRREPDSLPGGAPRPRSAEGEKK
jgi:hypothetical protein